LTPEALRDVVTKAAAKDVVDPTVSVIVKEIKSRQVYITGFVARPGAYSLLGPTTVLQLITVAGGLQDWANKKNITIIRTENGKQRSIRFNYDQVSKGENLQQNIELFPGDQIVVRD
jgi:polysaccharide export outer membrane protein